MTDHNKTPSQLLFEELNINLDEVYLEQLVNYTAVEYFLTIEDEVNSDADNLKKVNKYLESFHHLDELKYWKKASQITFFHLIIANNDQEFHWHLHDWGYLQEKIDICEPLLGKLQLRSEAVLLNSLAETYDRLGEFRKAISYQQKHLKIAQQIKKPNLEAVALNAIGNAYKSLGDFQQAIKYHTKALNIRISLNDFKAANNPLNNIGNAYFTLQEYETAYEYYQQVLEISRQFNDGQQEATALKGIADYYRLQEQYQKAIEYYEQALNIACALSIKTLEATTLNCLGITYKNLREYPKAIECYEKAILITRDIGDLQCEATIIGNIGVLYKNLNEHQKAIQFQEKALTICRKIGDREGEARAFVNLGNVYGKLESLEQAYSWILKGIFIYHDLQIKPVVQQLLHENFSFLTLAISQDMPNKSISKERKIIICTEIMNQLMTEVMGLDMNKLNTDLGFDAMEKIVKIAIEYS